MPNPHGPNPHFFTRLRDGSARVRMKFQPEEAALYEEAAGSTPVLEWVHTTLQKAAEREVAEKRRSRPRVRPQ